MTFVLLDLNLVIIIKVGFVVNIIFFQLNVAVYINRLSTKFYSNMR